MDELYKILKTFGKVKLNEPLAKHTSYKIGGPARYFVIVEDTDKLVSLLQFLDEEGEKYEILGGGSNILVHDDGYDGIIIQIRNSKSQIEGSLIICEAGCSTVKIAQESIKAGLTGFEWGVGVPGTIGGAVRGNAGIPTGEMKDSVVKAEVYRDGEVIQLTNEDCKFDYRESAFKYNSDVILRVWMQLKQGENKDLQKKALEYFAHRNATQPKGQSSGCIFKNAKINFTDSHTNKQIPEQFIATGYVPAGWLIDQCGLKGTAEGNAQISEKHGNFILNLGGAHAQDILILIDMIKNKVYTTYGIELEEEIRII